MLKLPKISRLHVFYILLFIYLVWPSRFAMIYYERIAGDEILSQLIPETNRNLSLNKPIQCDYAELLEKNQFFYRKPFNTDQVLNEASIKTGGREFRIYRFSSLLIALIIAGEYQPEDCNPSYSTAIIVPYRNRASQLHKFLFYMHNYLRKQQIHYRVSS